MIDAVLSLAAGIRTPREELLKALNPRNFVEIRRVPGGPSPEALRGALEQEEAHAGETRSWIRAKSTVLEAYPKMIREASARWVVP